jgi:radical SAM protein with 4Fe4S-binding SPASM domain
MTDFPFDESFYLAGYPDVAEAVRSGVCESGLDHYLRFGRHEGRRGAPVALPLVEAISAPTTDSVFLELTSRCNLRCVYCAVSLPTYHGIDLPLEGFENFVVQMKERGVRVVTMNGHGESTIVKGWETYAARLADEGFRLHMTTNLAKRLKPDEIDVLSRFEMLLVSIDTIDPVLMSQLRRGANLETILANIERILGHGREHGRSPEICISCTVGDLSAPGIPELIDALLARGLRTFRFGDLAEYEPIPDTLRMRHLSNVSADERQTIGARFDAAVERIRAAGGTAFVDSSITALFGSSLESAPLVQVEGRNTEISNKTVHYADLDPTQTRDCLDPWRIAFVNADGSVRPCCFFEEKLGTLAKDTLQEIVDGEAFRELRREIVTGQLRPNCHSCQARPVIDRKSFEIKLDDHIRTERARLGK